MKKRNQAVRILAGLCLPAALLLSSLFVSAAETGTNDIQTGTGTDNSSGTNTKSSTAENREDMDGSPEPRTEAEISVTEIRNAQEFLEFARNCSSDEFSLNRTVRLTADIDLSDAALSGNSFEGIPYFHGIFEGNGHTISQFKLTPKGSSHGFFRYIGEAGTVRNLNLDGIVRPEGSQEQIGGLAGVNYGVVENCSFTGSVRGKKSVGAVAGINKSTGKIISCRSNASVTATYYTGGIAGKNEGQISGCRSESSVNTEDPETTLDLGGVDLGSFNLTQNIVNQNHTGGIAGSSDGIINSCKNTGTVGLKHTGYNTGGIAGIQSGIILMCENEGEIHGRKDVGGIAGQTVPYVESEYLEDKVSKTKEDISRLSRTISGISSAMQKTSSQAKQYTDSLISRYNSSMQSVSGSLNALSGAVSREYPQAQEYVNQINNALAAISAIQNESQELSAEQLDAINSNLGIISDCLSRLQEILPDTSGSIQELLAGINSQLQNGANLNNIRDLAAAIDRQVSYIQNYLGAVSGSAGEIGSNLDTINGNLRNFEGSFSDTGKAAGDLTSSISDSINDPHMREDMKRLADTLDSGVQSISRGMNDAANQMNQIADSVSGDFEALMGDEKYISDISSIETAENTNGVISGCVNRGSISGDLNTGGIAGTMNVEYEKDPEFDLDLTDTAGITLRSTINSVVIHCINYGSVTAKKNCAGGITGLQELGFIYDGQGYGPVQSDTGNYLGGIAGKSSASVRGCYTLCNVSGRDFTGGICGSGYNITDCISASTIEGTGECRGSIAGSMPEDGTAEGNYFTASDSDGIDGISYTGIAEQKCYEDIMAMEQTPKGFEQITVTFMAEDRVLKEQRIAFGGSIRKSDYPEIPEKEGFYTEWASEEDTSDIRKNITITAEYIPWTKSVASSETYGNGKRLFLAAGEFYGDTKLRLTETEGPDLSGTGAQTTYAYTFELSASRNKNFDTLEGHFLVPENAAETQLWFQTDGHWSEAESTADGSYLTAQIPYGAAFALVLLPRHTDWYLPAAAGTAAVLTLAFFAGKRYRKYVKKSGRSENPR